MAEGIVYLDVDDEITSAASRIRNAPGTKVALVVPYGSRIATSRMNFRLLSREAVVSNRRLSIVSGDAAARSLAASAGLPVYGTVPEYEAAIARPASDDSAGAPAATPGAAGPAGGAAAASGAAAAGGTAASAGAAATSAADVAASGLAASETVAAVGHAGSDAPLDLGLSADAAPGRKSQRPKRPAPEPATTILPAAVADTREPARPAWGTADRTAVDHDAEFEDDEDEVSRGRGRGPLIAAVGLVGLAVVVLAVGAYLFLPAASIALTPRRDPIGPITLTVSADPEATDVDATNNVVPAIRRDVPVEAARTFTTTGTHVEEAAAHGSVTFTNYDTSSGVSIPRGSIVSTEGGVRFRTQATVALQPAAVFPAFQPDSGSVAVNAVKTGEGGNVPANTIRVVPQGQDPVLLRVNNPNATSGGVHTETPEVSKAEVDKAVLALQADLQKAFDDAVAAGAGAPADATLFPETAALAPSTPDPDPKTLVGQAVATFDLKLTAKGTVIAVDPRPVQTIARADLEGQVAKDHRLVADSVSIVVGEGTVGEDDQVTFQATASAVQVAVVDPDSLRSLVKGKTAAEARAALAPFGTATVTLWPDWASTVTGMDVRLSVAVDEAQSSGSPGASGAPSASPRRSPAPTGSVPARSASPLVSSSGGAAAPSSP
jgi:hypothetical protein